VGLNFKEIGKWKWYHSTVNPQGAIEFIKYLDTSSKVSTNQAAKWDE